MTKAIRNKQGQQVGILEWLPNGKVYGFSHSSKMQASGKNQQEVLQQLFRYQQVFV